MRLLFLDVDGVLNHPAHWDRVLLDKSLSHAQRQCDPACVARLLALVERTGCKMVVSSAHRLRSITQTRDRFSGYGIPPRLIVGVTPDLGASAGRFSEILNRGTEITLSLASRAFDGRVTAYAIVDDDDDMGSHLSRLVRTDPSVGLTDADCERLELLLTEGPR